MKVCVLGMRVVPFHRKLHLIKRWPPGDCNLILFDKVMSLAKPRLVQVSRIFMLQFKVSVRKRDENCCVKIPLQFSHQMKSHIKFGSIHVSTLEHGSFIVCY